MRRPFYLLAAFAGIAITAACSDSPSAPRQISHNSAAFGKAAAGEGSSLVPVFVIGDSEPHAGAAVVNFWGAQWWKNNLMTGRVDNGVASFKGYAMVADTTCGGTWVSRPGNSFDPPASIGDDILVVITSDVIKDGAQISGTVKQIVSVHQDGGYGPNPGHAGNGTVGRTVCGGVAQDF